MKKTRKEKTAKRRQSESKRCKYITLLLIEYGAALAVNASGSLAGTTVSHNRGGAYMRTKAIPTNPQTSYQTAVRNEFGFLSSNWRNLTAAERLQWNAVTNQFQRKNALSKVITLSGINLYKGLNQALFEAGQSLLVAPPVPAGATNINTASVAISAGGATMVLTHAPTPTPAGNTLVVYATAPLSPGISFVKNKLRKITTIPAATATGESLQAAYVAKFGATILGQKIAFGFKATNNTTGEQSVMLQVSAIVAA
jgi:hypothetical protein